MKKSLLAFALVAMVAAPAFADLVAEPILGSASHVSPRGVVAYDQENITTVYSRTAFPQSWDDDMLLDVTGLGEGPWLLDSFAWACYNSSSSAGPLATIGVTATFYNWDFESSTYILAGSHTWTEDLVADFGGVGLAPGWYGTFGMQNLNAEWGDIWLQQRMKVNLTFANPTGGSNRVGTAFSVGTAPTIGTSDPWFSIDGAHGYWFSSTPSYAFFAIDVLPEPMTLALLAVGGLALLRRR
jgi:hypothetical protein